jgi:hypothetical protein
MFGLGLCLDTTTVLASSEDLKREWEILRLSLGPHHRGVSIKYTDWKEAGLRPRSAVARFLGSRVLIPLRAWIFCCVFMCLCGKLIPLSGETYWLCVCVCLILCDVETLRMRLPRQELDFCDTEEKTEGNEWVIWKCCWECLSDVTIEVMRRHLRPNNCLYGRLVSFIISAEV